MIYADGSNEGGWHPFAFWQILLGCSLTLSLFHRPHLSFKAACRMSIVALRVPFLLARAVRSSVVTFLGLLFCKAPSTAPPNTPCHWGIPLDPLGRGFPS